MKVKNQSTNQSAFQLKGSVLTLSVLQLLTCDYSVIQTQLEELVLKNPNFFKHMPIIIDLQKISHPEGEINFATINTLLRAKGLVPVGIINANDKHIAKATEAGLGILPNTKTNQTPNTPQVEQAKVISQPVRSGQQIYAKNTDLIILASVSNGAEIFADGHIHVYGTLRGRAIAGASGNLQARIFCNKLEAELVAIAGFYRLQEQLSVDFDHSTGAQVYLENDQLIIASMN